MISFTQFFHEQGDKKIMELERPKKTINEIDRPLEIEALAHELIAAGCKFECEVLPTGVVNLDCQTADGDLLAMELSENDLGVLEAVDKMVQRAHAVFKKRA